MSIPTGRRSFLATSGVVATGAVSGCLGIRGSSGLTDVNTPESFVAREGNQFTVDGDPVVYNGAQVGISTRGIPFFHDPTDWIDTAFEFLAEHNVSAVRTWGYPENYWEPKTHPEPGTFDDTWFENFFDYAIAKAAEQNIRLVVPLIQGVHYHPDSPPSTEAYADWSDTATDRTDFFTDEQANQYYKNYIEHVLTRENSITGVQYRDDPTIMMWECGNEAGYAVREKRGESLAFWYDDIASYIKSLDDTHLVGSGMHGSMGEVYEDWTWRNNFVEEHRSPAIDACSFHAYPVRTIDDGERQVRPPETFREYIRHKVELAHNELNKPAYLGEIGTHYVPDLGLDFEMRERYFRLAGEAGREFGLNGIHFWRLVQFDRGDRTERENGEGKVTEASVDDEAVWDAVAENGTLLREGSTTVLGS